MKIEIIECLPQQKESSLSLMNPWMMKHPLFVNFINDSHTELRVFIEDAEEAKEIAQELLGAYNKLIHWIEKQEGWEE